MHPISSWLLCPPACMSALHELCHDRKHTMHGSRHTCPSWKNELSLVCNFIDELRIYSNDIVDSGLGTSQALSPCIPLAMGHQARGNRQYSCNGSFISVCKTQKEQLSVSCSPSALWGVTCADGGPLTNIKAKEGCKMKQSAR